MDVKVRDDGSGVVRVRVTADAEAVKAAESGGVKLEQAVRLGDLRDGGWTVGTWQRARDGSATLVLSRPFRNVSEVRAIFAGASGPSGPLRDVDATRESGLLSTEYRVRGRADLAHVTTGVATDPELLQSLSGQNVDANVIDQSLLAQVRSSFHLALVARLPGAKATKVVARPGKVTRIDATASVRHTERLLFIVAAAGFALLAVVVWRRGSPRRRRHQRRTRRQHSARLAPGD